MKIVMVNTTDWRKAVEQGYRTVQVLYAVMVRIN